MFRKFFNVVLLSAFALSLGLDAASNKISNSSIRISQPLSDTEVVAIRELKSWPYVGVEIAKDADDAAFASIAKLPELRYLGFANGNQQITSLEPVGSLKQLVRFGAYSQNNHDRPWSLRPFENCPDLVSLRLNRTLVSDWDSLRACTKLRFLDVPESGIGSLDFLRSMHAVQALSVGNADVAIESYVPIAELSGLRKLSIVGNDKVNDASLASLAKLTQLREFSCSKSALSSLDFLRNCLLMERVAMSRNEQLANIDGLAGMSYLRIAYLQNTAVSEIGALAGKPYLQDLSVSSTALTDLAPLSDATGLQKIDVGSSLVTDLSPLARKPYLKRLSLVRAGRVDFNTLPLIPQLELIDARELENVDLGALSEQPYLKRLMLKGATLQNVEALQELGSLEQLELSKGTCSEEQLAALRAALPNLVVVAY